MNVSVTFAGSDVGAAGLKLLFCDWALDPVDGTPFPNVEFGRSDDGSLVYWDGYGCDADSMPINTLYVDTGDLIVSRPMNGFSLEALNKVLDGVDASMLKRAFDEDMLDELGWTIVS